MGGWLVSCVLSERCCRCCGRYIYILPVESWQKRREEKPARRTSKQTNGRVTRIAISSCCSGCCIYIYIYVDSVGWDGSLG